MYVLWSQDSMCVLVSICRSYITTGTNIQNFCFGEKFEILWTISIPNQNKKCKWKKPMWRKKIWEVSLQNWRGAQLFKQNGIICFLFFSVVRFYCSVGFAPPWKSHLPRRKIWSCCDIKLILELRSGQLCETYTVPAHARGWIHFHIGSGCFCAWLDYTEHQSCKQQGIVTGNMQLVCGSIGNKTNSPLF